MSSSEYICYLNPDVILTEDILTPSIEILVDQSEVGLVACRLKNKDGSNQPSCFNFANSWSLPCEILHIRAVMPRSLRKNIFWIIIKPMMILSLTGLLSRNGYANKDARAIEAFQQNILCTQKIWIYVKKISVILKKQIFHFWCFIDSFRRSKWGAECKLQQAKKLFQNDMIFVRKFYGESEAKKSETKGDESVFTKKTFTYGCVLEKRPAKHLSKQKRHIINFKKCGRIKIKNE